MNWRDFILRGISRRGFGKDADSDSCESNRGTISKTAAGASEIQDHRHLKNILQVRDLLPGRAGVSLNDFEIGAPRGAKIFEQLQDVGDKRIAEDGRRRDRYAGALLNSPGVEQVDVAEQVAIAREFEHFLADAAKKNPKRFAGFACLPTAVPELGGR